MKQINQIITLTITAFMLTACGNSTGVTPTQNSALNSISNSNGKEKSGYMQKGLDSWLKDDWTPTVEKDEEIRSKYMEKVEVENPEKEEVKEVKYVEKTEKSFTLQELADKSAAYFKANPNTTDSNVEKMNNMPVIGKQK